MRQFIELLIGRLMAIHTAVSWPPSIWTLLSGNAAVRLGTMRSTGTTTHPTVALCASTAGSAICSCACREDAWLAFMEVRFWPRLPCSQALTCIRSAQQDVHAECAHSVSIAASRRCAISALYLAQYSRRRAHAACFLSVQGIVQAEDKDTEGYSIERLAGRSFDDEFGGTINNDVTLLQAAIFGIAIYTAIAISNCRDGCVGSRVLLTIGGAPPERP